MEANDSKLRLALALALLTVAAFLAGQPQQKAPPAPSPSATPAPEAEKIRGLATWYNAARREHSTWYTRNGVKLYAAAGPALRRFLNRTWEKGIEGKRGSKWRHAWITITSVASGKSATIRVLDWCGCHGRKHQPGDNRVVDLSPNAWRAIGQHFVRRVDIRRATPAEIKEWRHRQGQTFP
jgi:hypothetical protein